MYVFMYVRIHHTSYIFRILDFDVPKYLFKKEASEVLTYLFKKHRTSYIFRMQDLNVPKYLFKKQACEVPKNVVKFRTLDSQCSCSKFVDHEGYDKKKSNKKCYKHPDQTQNQFQTCE